MINIQLPIQTKIQSVKYLTYNVSCSNWSITKKTQDPPNKTPNIE